MKVQQWQWHWRYWWWYHMWCNGQFHMNSTHPLKKIFKETFPIRGVWIVWSIIYIYLNLFCLSEVLLVPISIHVCSQLLWLNTPVKKCWHKAAHRNSFKVFRLASDFWRILQVCLTSLTKFWNINDYLCMFMDKT